MENKCLNKKCLNRESFESEFQKPSQFQMQQVAY